MRAKLINVEPMHYLGGPKSGGGANFGGDARTMGDSQKPIPDAVSSISSVQALRLNASIR